MWKSMCIYMCKTAQNKFVNQYLNPAYDAYVILRKALEIDVQPPFLIYWKHYIVRLLSQSIFPSWMLEIMFFVF